MYRLTPRRMYRLTPRRMSDMSSPTPGVIPQHSGAIRQQARALAAAGPASFRPDAPYHVSRLNPDWMTPPSSLPTMSPASTASRMVANTMSETAMNRSMTASS